MSKDDFLFGPDAKRLLDMEDDVGRLLASDGWKALLKISEAQIEARKEMLLSYEPRPNGPSDDFLKGAIYGIRLQLNTPQTIMQQVQELHAQRAEEINE